MKIKMLREAVFIAASLILFLKAGFAGKLCIYTSSDIEIPSAAVWDLLFDNKGRLWLGTGKGVVLFDGGRVRRFTPDNTNGGLAKSSVVKIFQDSEGGFWFATRSSFIGGGGVSYFDGVSWKIFNKKNTNGGLPSDYVWDIAEDRDKNIWFATDSGVAVYNGRNWKVYNKVNTGLGIPGDSVWSIFVDKHGVMWFATNNGVGWFDGKQWKNVTTYNSGLKEKSVSYVFQSNDDKWWFGTRMGYLGGGGLFIYDGKSWYHYSKSNTDGALVHNDINVIFEDSKNVVWIGTRGGITVFANGKFNSFFEGDRIWDIVEDKSGNIFFAASRGLMVFVRGKLPKYLSGRGRCEYRGEIQ